MNLGEWLDFINKTDDELHSKAEIKRELDVQYANAYCEGYKQSAEDFAGEMRRKMRELYVKQNY